ncbi:hypothetical protein LEP1GSC073_1165 [Leptospira noguchii str. Cascata]|nr:hypothetical protein LEP1GSC073_1165 [Leptospira noguchii str. Cascata]
MNFLFMDNRQTAILCRKFSGRSLYWNFMEILESLLFR